MLSASMVCSLTDVNSDGDEAATVVKDFSYCLFNTSTIPFKQAVIIGRNRSSIVGEINFLQSLVLDFQRSPLNRQ